MAGKYDEHIYFINEQYDATHTNPLNTTAHIYQYFSDWLNDLQVQSTGNNSGREVQLNNTTILGSDTTTGPLKFGNSNAHNVIFSYTSGQLYADVGSNVFVDLLNNQTIDGQKDFNTVPRVKVTHETHNLPDTYQEVEYIESTGTQYIDTGLVGTVNTSYLVTAQAASNTAMLLFGSRTSATSNNLMCSTSDAYCLVDFGNYQQTRLQIIISTNKFTAYNSKNLRYINDTQSTLAYSGSLTTPGTMRIFDLSGNPPAGNTKGNGKLFICKVWDSDVLVREFIPCYRKSDNEVGLYDIVNNIFYTNQGTGDLIAGPDIALVTYESLLTDANFAPVAFSGSYTDLINQPTIPIVNNATLTIQKNGTTVQSFTANASSNVTANITVPTKTSDLTNDSGFITSSYHDSTKEDTSNKVTSISSSSTDVQYPSAKCVYDNIENVRETAEGKSTSYVINSKSEITGTEDPTTHNYSNVSAITGVDISELKIGDNIYIKDTDTPDYGVSSIYTSSSTILVDLSKLETVKPNIASISVNGTPIPPVNENVDITVSNQTIKAKNNGTNVTFGSNDVVEIVAGSNVSISANAAAKTITINATGGGGGGSTSVRVNDVTYSPDASGIVTLPNYPIIEDLTSL